MARAFEAITLIAVLGTLATVTTYPLIRGLTTHLAGDLGDPLLVTWILGWDADRIRHGLTGVWDAPNFFPYRHTLLYSEHFLGVALFTAPLQWVTRNPVLVYNLAFLASFVITGCGMYVLARWLTGRRGGAFIAAIAFAFNPLRASHVSHLQLLVIGWLPLSVWALHRYSRTRRLRDLLLSTLFYLLQTLTTGYFAYFALLPLSIVGVYELWRSRWLAARQLANLAIAVTLVIAVMLPVVRAYSELRQESGQRRSIDEITSLSADLSDYASASPTLRLWGGLGSGRGEHELFPGAIALSLALLSVPMRDRSRLVGLYAAILIAAVVLSLGPSPRLFGHSLGVSGPYAWLLHVVPGLDGLRVPARLAVVAQMALAVLAAFGAMWLIDIVAPKSRALGIAVVAILMILIAAEGWATLGTPELDPRGDSRDREAYAYLKSLPRGAAMELPSTAENVLSEFLYQYMTLIHGHPIVNGHSGYLTPLSVWLQGGHSPLREPGRQSDAVAMLRSIGVKYLVVHRQDYEDPSLRKELLRVIEQDPQILAHQTFEEATVAVLAPSEPPAVAGPVTRVLSASITARASDSEDRLPFLFDGDRDSRWLSARPQSGNEWLTLDLDRARDIRLVRMQLGTRSFGDYPRDLAIDAVDGPTTQNLFHGSVLPQLAVGIIADGDYPFIDIVLPQNWSKTLRLSQHGSVRTFYWSTHELQLFERQ